MPTTSPSVNHNQTNATISGVSIADLSLGNSAESVQLSVTGGTLAATASGTVPVTNNGTASITISGSVVDVNATLATLTYSAPALGTIATLTVLVTNANSATGNGLFTINLTDVNPTAIVVTTDSDAVTHTGVSLRDALATANVDARNGLSDTITFDPSLNNQTILLRRGNWN